MQNGQQSPMPNFSLNDTRDIPCECGNLIFMPGMRFKKVSRLITGEAKDSIIPIEVFLCTQCGKPLQELMPDELKDKESNNMAGKSLFDHIKAITTEQDPKYFEQLSEEDRKSWSNFMINRFLSMNPHWVELIASILPLTQSLEPKDMYKLYINVIPKGRYFLKYMKGKSAEKYEEFIVTLIKNEYLCSEAQAHEYLEILYATREGRENIKYICEKYGIDKKQITKLKLKI